MARPSSKDPLDKFRWSVSIDGFTKLGFTSCEVPKVTFGTNSYPEGGNHLFPKQIVDSAQYKPVSLTRGVTSDKSFHTWASDVINFSIMQSKTVPLSLMTQYRRTVTIGHLDRAGKTIRTYILYNAFPIEYEPASDFSADADDTLSMEKLVLSYESFEVVVANDADESGQLGLKDVAKKLIRGAF
jgi:phage tail-like protein